MRGKFPSRKNGRMVHHEGMLEVDAIYLFELSRNVVAYREQATPVHYTDGARSRKYTPDFEVDLRSGASLLIEVKPEFFANSPETKHKLQCIHAHMDRVEQTFLVLTEQSLRQQPRQTNLRAIYHQADRLPPTEALVANAMARIRDQFPLNVRAANALLEPLGINACSLLTAGVVGCNVSAPFSLETDLYLLEEADHEWFWIAQEHRL